MPLTVDWPNKIIYPDRAEMVQIQTTPIAIYQLDLTDFHIDLRDLEDEYEGIVHDWTHNYTAPKTLSGVTYAQLIEIVNDYTVTFLPDAAWVVQITGGNSNVGDRVNPNNVSVQVSNSAGLQDATALRAAQFRGYVTIDVVNGQSGTTHPLGTQGFPVDNLTDAIAIAEANFLSRFLVLESFTITNEDLAEGFTFFAEKHGVTLTIQSAADITNCSFEQIAVTGTLDSNNNFYRCEVYNATSLQAVLTDCVITGTLTLGGTGLTELLNCHSGVAGAGAGQYPTVNMGVSGNDLLVRDYSGGLGIENMNDANVDVSIDMDSGRVVVESDVSAGTITVRGIAEVTDNSTGTAVVEDDTLTKTTMDNQRLMKNRRETDPTTGRQRVYADDDTTIWIQGDLFEDIAGTQPYQGQGADRADRMS